MAKKPNDTTGISGGDTNPLEPQTWTTPSFPEVYLKPEPVYEDTMFHETDCEFFQDLIQWCSDSDNKIDPAAIDIPKKCEEGSRNIDTLHTTFSPQSWDVLDANSPSQAGLYTSTPCGPLSPNMDGSSAFDNNILYNSEGIYDNKTQFLEPNLDILNLPVVIGNLASEEMVDLNPYPPMEAVDCYNNTTQNTEYTPTLDTHKLLLHNDEEDSLDMKLGSVIMEEVENNVVVFGNDRRDNVSGLRPRQQLSINLATTPTAIWPVAEISTPEVLSYVEQLEKEKCTPIAITKPTEVWSSPDTGFISMDSCSKAIAAPPANFEALSPKSESHVESDLDDAKTSKRKRLNSEDSDETYTPYSEQTSTRKYKRRKPNIPIKDMIRALEESQQFPKARRGRPPKRRESNVSSACSIDDNASCASSHEFQYRIQRDKNNEASKKSRMNRKLKELQMEQLALELEKRNKKLQVKADILEDMTKRLKEALMTAIMQKQK